MKQSVIRASIFSALSLLPFFASAAPADLSNVTAVLVHGAWADGSSWAKVIPLLEAKGMKVVAVQNPLSSLADDVRATQRVVDAQKGPVVLVAHSWGGTVITQAGTSNKVKALVYVAAHAPSKGESVADEGKGYPVAPAKADLKPDANGFLTLTPESLAKNFAQDLTSDEIEVLTATQGPILAEAFATPVNEAAWTTKPNYYIVAAKDRTISPVLEKALAAKLHAVTTILQTSHVAMLAQPAQVARVIIEAAVASAE